MIESLKDENFTPVTMVRPGLMSLPADPDMARGQLVSSVYTAMKIDPEIVHVVAYCEATRRASDMEIIESVKMAKQAINEAIKGLPDFKQDKVIQDHKEYLKSESATIIEAMEKIKTGELTSSETIYAAIKLGILDAPGLSKMSVAKGAVRTAIIDGQSCAVDEEGKRIDEKERLSL